MDRLFIKTEMYLKSKAAASASMPNNKNVMVPRSRSSDVLPTSQSQVNIQMMSHTLTIREVNSPVALLKNYLRFLPIFNTLRCSILKLNLNSFSVISYSEKKNVNVCLLPILLLLPFPSFETGVGVRVR
jgi:hypothetical protein